MQENGKIHKKNKWATQSGTSTPQTHRWNWFPIMGYKIHNRKRILIQEGDFFPQ